MKLKLLTTIAALMAMGVAHAQAEVYLCVGEGGQKEYKNVGTTKGCTKVDLPGLTMIPAPAKRAGAVQTAAVKAPADFPKVESSVQKSRDEERRQILLDEIKAEEKKLAELKKEYGNGEPERRGDERNYAKYQERVAAMKEDLARTERNIEALRREIGNLK